MSPLDSISHELLLWFAKKQRPLPWRNTPQPYTVWISEIMAQQTQMERVVSYFERFLKDFPDINTLADAPEDDVLKLWEGLGYYSRARNLHKAAKVIVSDYGGVFPATRKQVLALPGVGPYTAGAIMSIAYDEPVVAVDANVERVAARLFDIAAPVKEKSTVQQIRKITLELMGEHSPRQFTQAIMEFGALVCKPRNPDCIDCPLALYCESLRAGTVLDRPAPTAKAKNIKISMATGVLVRDGKIYIQKRKKTDVWPGLWEFPGGVVEDGEKPEQTVVREYMEETGLPIAIEADLGQVKHSYTRFRVTQHCYFVSSPSNDEPQLNVADDGMFVTLEDLNDYAFPAGHRMLRDKLIAEPQLLRLA